MILMRFYSILIIILLLTACGGSTPVKQDESLIQARFRVDEAINVNAQEYAPHELKFALEKLAAAEVAFRDKEYKEVRRLAEQAAIDAQLAYAKTLASKAREQAQQQRQENETLRKQFGVTN